MTVDKGLSVLLADFNSAEDGETLVARLDEAAFALFPGSDDRVKLRDVDGNECDGVIVAAIIDSLFRVRVEWDTWTDADGKNQVSEGLTPTLDLMDALRRSVAEAQQARTGDIPATRGRIGSLQKAG